MGNYKTTRADDEMVLDWLARRRAGNSFAKIARAYGVQQQRERRAVERVMQADRDAHGEPR